LLLSYRYIDIDRPSRPRSSSSATLHAPTCAALHKQKATRIANEERRTGGGRACGLLYLLLLLMLMMLMLMLSCFSIPAPLRRSFEAPKAPLSPLCPCCWPWLVNKTQTFSCSTCGHRPVKVTAPRAEEEESIVDTLVLVDLVTTSLIAAVVG